MCLSPAPKKVSPHEPRHSRFSGQFLAIDIETIQDRPEVLILCKIDSYSLLASGVVFDNTIEAMKPVRHIRLGKFLGLFADSDAS